ncbi:pitrilysin family protein [Flammeovirga sp. SJP92]|uniref:M16 family metallopeptidase n=1 Tax=Flammeovirga sp. SJP92 TaxID=1775430 RepID=UPI0007879A25|nr:pitrilysin family protein [Flammeovirga sp. SJP92]KXX68272.1 hypothetical protein AVL50_20985 [Flammeovirga sp. SJP92]
MNALDRSIPPKSYSIKDFSLPKPSEFTLDNSCKVFSIPNSAQPIIHFSLYIKGGKLLEKEKGAAALTAKMMGEGVEGMDSKALHQKLESYGAILSTSSDIDSFTISGHCMKRYFAEVIQLVKKYLTVSTFAEKDFSHILQVMLQQQQLNEEKTSYLSTKLFRENFYGDQHPYGKSLSSEALKNFQLNEVSRYYQENILGNPFQLFITGDVGELEIKEINKYLGSIAVREDAVFTYPDFVSKISSPQLNIYQEKEDAVQTSIRIGCPTFTLPNPDLEAFTILNEVLGGYFGSRLMKNVREEKGLTYGIHSSFRNETNQGYFLIATDLKKESKDLALQEIYKEINILTEEEISEEELETVKNYMTGNFVMSINSNLSLLEVTKSLYKKGLPFNYYDDYVSRIQEIESPTLKEVANKYFKQDMLEICVG